MNAPATETTKSSGDSALDMTVQNVRSNKANQKAVQKVRAVVFGMDVAKARGANVEGEAKPSEVLPEDPFGVLEQSGRVIQPPFDMLTLSMMNEYSSELGPCIEAMEVNIDGYGHRFVSRLKPKTKAKDDSDLEEGEHDANSTKDPKEDPEEAALRAEAAQEFADLTNFFNYCTDESFKEFRRKIRKDYEQTGNAYAEILRTTDGKIAGFFHIPSYMMRLGKLDDDAQLVKSKVTKLLASGEVTIVEQQEWKKFRSYVQSRALHLRTLAVVGTDKVRWFKSFGDPRDLDKNTGDYGTADKPVAPGDKASEIVHFKLYSTRSPYGIPRFIGNLLSIFGDRAAEEINYTTFRNNNIPSMVFLCSNGQLTQGSIDRIESFVESAIQGSDNYSKFLIVEAENAAEEGEDGEQVKLDIKPLVSDQHKDALFQNYSKNNQDRVRRAFRLPKIFVANSDGYNRATAEADRRLADEQVFAPERDVFDDWINRRIFPEMGIRYHSYKSNTPNTTDNQVLVKILATAEKTGGISPAIARRVLEDVLGYELPPFPSGFDPDVPFSLTMAEAVKNQADAAEPGQQVTALKALKSMGMLTDDGELDLDFTDDSTATIIAKLETLHKALLETRAA